MKKNESLGALCGRCRAMEEAAARLGLECEIVKGTAPMTFIDCAIAPIVVSVWICLHQSPRLT